MLGLSVSGGYVPGLGWGGYLSGTWGAHPLGQGGLVAEAGLFRGVHNPLRSAATGLGLHALAGWEFAPWPWGTVRLVAGGGVPFPGFPSAEFLAKVTAGVAF